MAGRDISVTHDALGPVRVMRTCGMMGEIVGKAAWIAVRHETSPRGVYEKHLALLKELMTQPGALRRAPLGRPLALPPGATLPVPAFAGINPATLEGIVIDDEYAELRGKWDSGSNLTGFAGRSCSPRRGEGNSHCKLGRVPANPQTGCLRKSAAPC